MGENPKKYHITDDGDVYRVNEDGSFTSMGNAENIYDPKFEEASVFKQSSMPSSDSAPVKPFAKSNYSRRLWLYSILFLILIVGIIAYNSLFSNKDASMVEKTITQTTDTTASSSTVDIDAPLEEVSTQDVISQAEQQSKLKEEQPTATDVKPKEQQIQVAPNNEPRSHSEIQTSNTIDPNKIYYSVEVQAEFPGGDRARRQWLQDNISWPRDNNGSQLHGDVELEFIIERDGSVSNVKVTYSDNSDLNSAAINLISSMPQWSPAMVNNQPVRSPMGITLFF